MLNLNRAQILGNLTRDPEMRTIPSGQTVMNFSVATNRRWRRKESEDWQEEVQYHNVVAWGRLAEGYYQGLKKGDPVYVEGRLQTRNWEGQDGVKRSRTEIVAERIIPLKRREGTTPFEEQPTKSAGTDEPPLELETASLEGGEKINPEDIPF